MAGCVIHPIPLMEFPQDKSMMTWRLGYGQTITMTAYVWYIQGTRERILVDGGVSFEYMSKYRPPQPVEALEAALNKLGVSPADIDLVILTHLHHDHVGQASLFTRAKFLVQEKELKFARNPHPLFAFTYPPQFFQGLNFEVVNGDTKVSDEVSVISTPGHSPGGQSVAVKTAAGTAVICGLCGIYENFEPPASWGLPVMIPGFHTDTMQAYDSLLRIKKLAKIPLALHDPRQKATVP